MKEKQEMQHIFLIADLSGYTALTEAHGSISAAQIVKRYIEIVRECLLEGSRLVETVGDEVLIIGNDASHIIQVGINLREKVENEPNFPAVHIGIHAGDVLEQDGRFFGSAINIASRTAAYARAGQIIATAAAIKRVADENAISYQPLGEIQFKNIAEPISIFEIDAGHSALNVNATDPVCRMGLKPATALGRLNYQGQNYFFCSFECARAFASHPERYMK
ncbi:MAG: YHS domain-containing protein [Deltaproteobacteria bacterium]|jgi:adenylate cyclase